MELDLIAVLLVYFMVEASWTATPLPEGRPISELPVEPSE